MPSYSLSPEAQKDLLNIRTYTQKEWGSQQTQKYIDALEKRCDELAQRPHTGRERPEIKPGYRSVAEGKHVIFYRVCDSGIEILRIPHGRMDIEHRLVPTQTTTNESKNGEIWLLLIYSKSARENIPARVLRAIREEIKDASE